MNKIVFVSGNFNVIHPGHLRILKFAKSLGDELIVGVIDDTNNDLITKINAKTRLESIQALTLVDHAFIIKDITEYLLKCKPSVVVKGKEFELKMNIEKNILDSYGGELIFCSGDVESTDYSNVKFTHPKTKLMINHDYDFLQRHNIYKQNLLDIVEKFRYKKVIVFGELILDEYIHCDALGMSSEEPALVVCPVESKMFIGGAAIVASHAGKLGSSVEYISVLGDNIYKEFIENNLISNKVQYEFINDLGRPTILKQRIVVDNKVLLKISKLKSHDISEELQHKIINIIKSKLINCDLFIFSDFNYGVITKSAVEIIINLCHLQGVKILADSQISSQSGNINKFKNIDLISATEKEARISMQNNSDGLVVLANNLLDYCNSNYCFLKINKDGVLISINDNKLKDFSKTDIIKALNDYPVDVSGAGDSMLIASGLSIISSANIWEAAYIASIASAIQVSRTGNVPITQQEIISCIMSIDS
jgi:rfaE bifunctional protein kinase chain/domain